MSITFIHDVAPHSRHKWIVGTSWGLFAASLLLILASFLTSERAIRRMVHRMAEPEASEITEGRITDWANWMSASAFMGGVVCLVIFALLNV